MKLSEIGICDFGAFFPSPVTKWTDQDIHVSPATGHHGDGAWLYVMEHLWGKFECMANGMYNPI